MADLEADAEVSLAADQAEPLAVVLGYRLCSDWWMRLKGSQVVGAVVLLEVARVVHRWAVQAVVLSAAQVVHPVVVQVVVLLEFLVALHRTAAVLEHSVVVAVRLVVEGYSKHHHLKLLMKSVVVHSAVEGEALQVAVVAVHSVSVVGPAFDQKSCASRRLAIFTPLSLAWRFHSRNGAILSIIHPLSGCSTSCPQDTVCDVQLEALMTGGNVVFPSTSTAPGPSLPRAVPRYSIDAFSEFSVFALSRTPTTASLAQPTEPELRSTQEQDEELFRDLFAADNDWDAPPSSASQLHHLSHKNALLQQHKVLANAAPPLWSSNTTSHAPFLPVAAAKPEPTLSARVPRLNLAELMNPRPVEGSDRATGAGVWSSRLDQVTENEEEDGGDAHAERPESNGEPHASSASQHYKLAKLKPSLGGSSNSTRLQQETLSFLEKLDLKALLHTPRPDVLDFCPANNSGTAPSSLASTGLSNQAAPRADDTRIETERAWTNNSIKARPIGATINSSGNPKASAAEVASRLAFVETAYGTTKHEAQKARKGTIERLANPILGYTSTLQALSPEQRRKRGVAVGVEARNPFVGNPTSSKLQKRETRPAAPSCLDRLTSSTRVYEAAAASSSSMQVRMHASALLGGSNNQLDNAWDSHTSSKNRVPLVKKKVVDKKTMSARKAALKKRLGSKQQGLQQEEAQVFERTVPNRTASTDRRAGSTFLTQHEDDEAAITSRPKRPQPVRQPLAAAKRAGQQAVELEARQPRPPPSVRSTKVIKAARFPASEMRESTAECRDGTQQKPKRSSGKLSHQQQQSSVPAPRKPSDLGRSLARRPVSSGSQLLVAGISGKANALASSNKLEPTTPLSVPKRRSSGGRPSAAALLLMGPDAAAPAFAASTLTPLKRGSSLNRRQQRKTQPVDVATPVRTAPTPRKSATTNSRGSAMSKDAPASGRRGSRLPKEIGSSARKDIGNALPVIPPPSRGKPGSEFGARRKNCTNRRVQAS